MIYHYTTIESLEAILASGSIKFNKLTNMDDMAEFENFVGEFNPKEYVFVSSWTKDSEENVTLWNCYTDNKIGVRIALEDIPFPLFFPSHPRLKITKDFSIHDVPWLLMPFDEAFTKDYFIMSFYHIKDDFEKEVVYLDEADLKQKYQEYALKSYDPKSKTINTYSGELAGWKNKIWGSQKEFRFVLVIFPQNKEYYNPTAQDFTKNYIQGLLQNINKGEKNNIEYYLLKMRREAIAKMNIMLSPYADEADSQRVVDILDSHHIPLTQYSRSSLRIQYKK